MTGKLVTNIASIEADLEQFESGADPTLDTENIRDLILEVELLRSEVEGLTEERDMWQEHYHRVLTELAALKGDPTAQAELLRRTPHSTASDQVPFTPSEVNHAAEALDALFATTRPSAASDAASPES